LARLGKRRRRWPAFALPLNSAASSLNIQGFAAKRRFHEGRRIGE